ncbi:MAG: class I SAM-dependent methyltransferase [Opitutus sp.]|nr:class I SAM-dependent methyltransferase [Opitutus sp.]
MSFDTLAPHYRWMEAVLAGPRLQRARTAWLDQLRDSPRILVAGVGHGPFLPALVRRVPHAQITAVDSSMRMLRQSLRRVGSLQANITFVHARLPEWTPTKNYDAIVTHFFLDCFPPEQLARVIDVLDSAAMREARWLVSDFALPPRGWRRTRARAIHWLMYRFFRVATRLPAHRWTDPSPLLQARGYQLLGRDESEWGLLRSDCWMRSTADVR